MIACIIIECKVTILLSVCWGTHCMYTNWSLAALCSIHCFLEYKTASNAVRDTWHFRTLVPKYPGKCLTWQTNRTYNAVDSPTFDLKIFARKWREYCSGYDEPSFRVRRALAEVIEIVVVGFVEKSTLQYSSHTVAQLLNFVVYLVVTVSISNLLVQETETWSCFWLVKTMTLFEWLMKRRGRRFWTCRW